MILFKKKKPKLHICPKCGKEWDENKLGRRRGLARKIALSGPSINLGLTTISNPFDAVRPEKAEDYCIICLREAMDLDKKEISWKTLQLQYKEDDEECLDESTS